MYSLIFTTLLTIKNRSLFYCTIFETKKNRSSKNSCFKCILI